MKRILFLIIILFLFSGIALGTELGAGDGTGYPGTIDTDTSVEVDYPDPLATTARAAVPNDTNAAVIAIETELGINPSGAYDTLKARLDAGDGLYYLKTEIDTKFAELKFTDLSDTPADYTGQAGKYTKVNAGETALEFGTPAGTGTYLELTDTPGAYDNGKYAKSTADGVVWDDPAGGGASTFLELTDTPISYTGKAGEILRVNATPDGVEFSGVGIETTLTVDSDAKIPTSKAVNDFCEITKNYALNSELHAQNTDTALGIQTQDLNMGTHKITNVVDPVAYQDVSTKAYADGNCDLSKDQSPQLSNDLDLNDQNIKIDADLDTDHNYSGLIDVEPVGESVVFGDLLYFDWTDKEWKLADADLAANMPGLRIALESKSDGQACIMLVKGYIRDDSAFEFAGSMIYASVTPGAMSSTAPTETGDQVQRVGVAKSADILFFDPSIDVGEI